MKYKGAAGPDKVPSSFLKSLNLLALHELLSIFNSSFSIAHCPRIWRIAKILQLGNLLVKLHLSVRPTHPVLPNFWNIFLLIVNQKICSAHSKLDFVKVGAAKIKLLVQYKQQKLVSNLAECNALYWLCQISVKHTIWFGEKSRCLICQILVFLLHSCDGFVLFSTTTEHASYSLTSLAPVVVLHNVYLKAAFSLHYSSCSILIIQLPCSKIMQLQLSLLMTSQSLLRRARKKTLKVLLSQQLTPC